MSMSLKSEHCVCRRLSKDEIFCSKGWCPMYYVMCSTYTRVYIFFKYNYDNQMCIKQHMHACMHVWTSMAKRILYHMAVDLKTRLTSLVPCVSIETIIRISYTYVDYMHVCVRTIEMMTTIMMIMMVKFFSVYNVNSRCMKIIAHSME